MTPPPFPDLLGYLWEWALEIRRGLGFDLHGLAPLSWVTLDAWCRRTHTEPDADEVTALFALDAVMREKEPPKVVGAPVTNRIAAFPSKKEFV